MGGDPFVDFDTVVKILFFVVVFGGWIVSSIFKNLIKPAAKRPPAGGPPAKGLREFLEEIRQEAAGGPPAAPAAPARPVDEVVWEEIEDAGEIGEVETRRPAAPQGQRTAFDERREQLRRETERRRAERERRRLEQARRRQEELEAERGAEEPQREWVSVAERRLDSKLDSKLDERDIGSNLDDRQLESRLADRHLGGPAVSRAPAGARRVRAPELVGALRGLTIRELILADVILGKPSSQRRHTWSRRRSAR